MPILVKSDDARSGRKAAKVRHGRLRPAQELMGLKRYQFSLSQSFQKQGQGSRTFAAHPYPALSTPLFSPTLQGPSRTLSPLGGTRDEPKAPGVSFQASRGRAYSCWSHTESVDTESVDKSARSETEITCIEKSSKWQCHKRSLVQQNPGRKSSNIRSKTAMDQSWM